MMHLKNGNRIVKKPKNHFKVLQVNKGNSDFRSSHLATLQEINDHSPDVAIIGESNMKEEDKL